MELKKISPYCYEIPRSGSMIVPGRIFMSGPMAAQLSEEEALKQVANVAALPGILKAAMAMPDMHWGYGFPIGGVAAFDWDTGVISPGGVGYDINCGVRLAATGLEEKEVRPVLDRLVNALFQNIPSGVGSTGSVKLSPKEEMKVLREGGSWAVRHGFGEVGEQHGDEQQRRHRPADARRGGAGQGEAGGQQRAQPDHGHDRVLEGVLRGQFGEGTDHGGAEARAVEQGPRPAGVACGRCGMGHVGVLRGRSGPGGRRRGRGPARA